MTVSTRGNTKKYVTHCCVGVNDLAWSRDGKKIILFSDGSAGPDGAIVNANGSHLRILHINGHEPAWSPDSKRIAFTDGSHVLYIINANGTGLRTLTDARGVIGPTWMLHGPIAIVSPAASTGWAPSVDAMTTDRLACRRAADRQ